VVFLGEIIEIGVKEAIEEMEKIIED